MSVACSTHASPVHTTLLCITWAAKMSTVICGMRGKGVVDLLRSARVSVLRWNMPFFIQIPVVDRIRLRPSVQCVCMLWAHCLSTIDHKYMESGHSQMEWDSVHAAVETARRKVCSYSPDGHYLWGRQGTTTHTAYMSFNTRTLLTSSSPSLTTHWRTKPKMRRVKLFIGKRLSGSDTQKTPKHNLLQVRCHCPNLPKADGSTATKQRHQNHTTWLIVWKSSRHKWRKKTYSPCAPMGVFINTMQSFTTPLK